MNNKELTPLEWLNYYKNKLQSSSQTFRPDGFDIIESALKRNNKIEKALKIIVKKKVNVWLLTLVTFERYNAYANHRDAELTLEEYYSVREVLSWITTIWN